MVSKFSWGVLCAAGLLPMFAVGDVSAETYKVRGAGGTVYFTNARPADPRASIIKRFGFQRRHKNYAYNPRHFSNKYDSIITGAALRNNIDPMWIKAVVKVESDFERYSISRVGARGLMQLMPGTAKEMKVKNVFDPAQNIYGGSGYLRKMINRFGNMRLALAAYNAGPTAVAKYQGIPPFDETENYVKKVNAAYSALAGKAPTNGATVTPRKKAAKVKKVVYYTYENSRGITTVTDKPIGSKNVID